MSRGASMGTTSMLLLGDCEDDDYNFSRDDDDNDDYNSFSDDDDDLHHT